MNLLPPQRLLAALALAASAALVSVDLSAPPRIAPVPVAASAPVATAATAANARLDFAFQSASGAMTSFAATDGRVRIATMFYTHCPSSCPLTLARLQAIEHALPPAQRARLAFVLLTLDPVRDSPAALRALGLRRHLGGNFVLGRTTAGELAGVAHALGVSYRALADASIDHGTALTLFDARGKLIARSSDAADPDPEFLTALRETLR